MDILNFITVTLYGNIIMLLFTDKTKNKLQICGIFTLYLLCGLINLLLHQSLSNHLLYMLYPFTVHLPLLLYYIYVMKTPFSQAVFALTAAYILTTPRKWICIFTAHLLGGSIVANAASEILLTALLLFLIAKFIAPVVTKIFASDKKEANYLCLMPAAVYVITYATTVYSDLLFQYPMVTIPVLTSVLSIFFIGFEVYFFDYAHEKADSRHSKELLELQLCSVERLAGYVDGAENYFCENKTVNAFLSMYQAATEKKGVLFVCSCNLPSAINTFEILAVITSMLDDAINTAKQYIKLEALQKKNQISIMVQTDGASTYKQSALKTLRSFVEKNNGIVDTDKNHYKIQISIKKGEGQQ